MAATKKEQERIQQVHDAAAQYLPSTSVLQLGGQQVKVTDLIADLQAALSAYTATANARLGVTQALQTQQQKVASAAALIEALKPALITLWGKGNPQLVPFGFAPKAPKPLTSQQKTLKAAKAKLTRDARGTTSKKQKQQVTASGSPGLVLVQPDGTQVSGVLQGAVPPAGASKGQATPPGNTGSAQGPASPAASTVVSVTSAAPKT